MGLFSIPNTEDEPVFVSGDKWEAGERKGTIKQREKRQRKTETKAGNEQKKEQAVAYLCESEHMNMEEPNDSKVQSSKCFTNYQAAANKVNMILFKN